jgi:proteasome lid subunit RPN8/RPN11
VKLLIAAADLDAIAAAAAAAFPEECCGLLVGERHGDALVVTRIVAAANVAVRPESRFEVDPATLFKAHRSAREAGQTVIGHYHSHPPGRAAVPSPRDRARAYADGELWLIVPAHAEGAGAARAHLFEGGDFREIEIAPGP